jgi:hypothetical protein
MATRRQERAERILQAAYSVQGVSAARVWFADEQTVAIGVRGAGEAAPSDLLRRLENALIAFQEPDEKWEYGLLGDG